MGSEKPQARPNTRRRRRNQLFLWLGTLLVIAILLAVFRGQADDLGVPPLAQQGVLVIAILGLLGLSAWQWRELDEMGRQAHATAFFWSGMISWSGVLLVVSVGVAGGGGVGPSMPVFGSALMVIAPHALLYGVIYAAISLRNRLP